MNIKKILLGTLFSAALCLTACSDGNNVGNDNAAETVSETVPEAEEAVSEVSVEKSVNLTICGKEYSPEDIYIEIDGNTLTETDMENIRRLKSLSAVSIENPTPPLVEMFAENPLVTKINLSGCGADISEYTTVLKGFETVTVNTENYSEKSACELCKAVPEADIMYSKSSGGLRNVPADGIVFTADHFISFDKSYEYYSTAKREALTVYFTNYTDKTVTARKAEILYNGADGVKAAEFSDGQSFLQTDISIGADGEAEFAVDNSMFDFEHVETGLYTIRFTFDSGSYEQDFFIANSDGGEFLTEEQRTLLNEAYEMSHKYIYDGWQYCSSWGDIGENMNISDESVETLCQCFTKEYVDDHKEWLRLNSDGSLYDAGDNRGGSYVYSGHFFSPVYSDDEQIIFKATVVNYHGDNPYFMWYDSINYRMVKTEDGWRFDTFTPWF